MVAIHFENHNKTSLSHSLENTIELDVNLEPLKRIQISKMQELVEMRKDLFDESITNSEFLEKERKDAETKIIKARIIYKLQ